MAALRLLSLTGARLSEVLNLRWDEIADLSAQEGGGARLPDTKTGPRTLWFGPDAAKLVSSLPRRGEDERIFPDDLTTHSLYAVWTRLRAEAGLDGVRIHDLRHSFASQGVMNGEGLPTVGRLLGHRHRATTAIYAHLDDATLQDAAARAAGVIAQAMRFEAGAPPLPDHMAGTDSGRLPDWSDEGADAPSSYATVKDDAESNIPRGWIVI